MKATDRPCTVVPRAGMHLLCALHLQASGDGAISVQTLACHEPGARPELDDVDTAGAEQASQALGAAVVQEALSRVRQVSSRGGRLAAVT